MISAVDSVLTKLQQSYPHISFQEGKTFYWSPSDQTVYYKNDDKSVQGMWALLHEVGHGLLGHSKYYSDFELVRMEMEAWEKAKEIHGNMENGIRNKGEPQVEIESPYSISPISYSLPAISEEHIQDCLDSYRDWLHKRSLCPDCSLSGIQTDARTYTCIFCHKKWHVTAERFCRPYRSSVNTHTEKL